MLTYFFELKLDFRRPSVPPVLERSEVDFVELKFDFPRPSVPPAPETTAEEALASETWGLLPFLSARQ